jgi:hypothetical protein
MATRSISRLKIAVLGVVGMFCCLVVGAGIARAQGDCANVGCLVDECLHPYETAFSLHTEDGEEDSIGKGVKCALTCFIWSCDQSLTAKSGTCTKSPEDVGMLAYTDTKKGGDVILVRDVARKDAIALTNVIQANLRLVPFNEIEAKLTETISLRHKSILRYSQITYNAKIIEGRKTGKFRV